MSEQSLAAAVVAQAYEDYCAGVPSKSIRPDTYAERLTDYREARLFCTATHGAWAKSRERWCALAGIDAEAFRQKCAPEEVKR